MTAVLWPVTFAALLAGACASLPQPTPLRAGARYVAMGSSFAAGPGVTVPADARDPRCSRSRDNYAQQTARALRLTLVDVSCGGATTAHVVDGWNELPAQVAAITPETALVTVTIGGNDVGYIGRMMAQSCAAQDTAIDAVKAVCAGMRARAGAGSFAPPSAAPNGAAWQLAEAGMQRIADEVRRRAPKVRLIFVQYIGLVPKAAPCATVPLDAAAMQVARNTAARLAQMTSDVAKRNGAEVLAVADLSKEHDACAPTPWAYGFIPLTSGAGFAPYHPNLDGMTAVADALIAKLR